ncbi:prepilin-type N-terminal cleavage/methylation domain-containing protein [Marinobacterium weihaiense]|uniref:Prepilin-type N-terminal cleavage/methylation domain-containing protein n=1 Tax=Marinobacterium weihaiense TaxID=2851016 RepID=A0ABS6MDB0_9GAMM|nr:prepilin-type N-terminal cleavage/methylation domain-containing protein [Marinobacterium weihaiense]MBV0934274.1 prepilin-type N-terminal cleavage/methylation domain-containing protein [Marinobacterium weihaiense]
MKATAGFTLIELLIALVLMGLLMLLVLGGLSVGGRGWEAGERYQQQQAEQYQLQQVLRGLLAQAQNLRVRSTEGEVLLAFQGEPDRLTFVAPGRAGDARTALYWYRLQQDEQADGHRLVLLARAYRAGEPVDWTRLFEAESAASGAEPVVSERHELMALASRQPVLGYQAPNDAADALLRSEWRNEPRLPRRVEVALSGESTAPAWPTLAVALDEYSHALRRRQP